MENAGAPSLFGGQFGEALEESFRRIQYGGVPSGAQKVYFINLQEIKGIRFGTRNPINYFDQTYNAELFLRAHGTYSIKITDPLRFYAEAVPRNRDRVEIEDINEQYFSEFMEALQAAINQMSADGVRISYVPSKGRELSRYMSSILDEDWKLMRGIEVQSVGIASISYDEESDAQPGRNVKRRVDSRRICAGGNGPRNRGGGLQCERFRRRVHGDWNGNAVRCRDGGGLFSKQPAANKAGTSRIRRLEMQLRRAKRGRGSVLFTMRQKKTRNAWSLGVS